ncbi:hypothetical protein OIT41_02510 [Arthrobacter sp. YA7-1]|nr:hypothetical protein OIT41_02510 [Arthrobacter sp. YA7-1]
MTFYRTKARFWDAISEQAFFHWKNGQAHGPEDLPMAVAELPSRYASRAPSESSVTAGPTPNRRSELQYP